MNVELAGVMRILLRKTAENEGTLTCFRPDGTRAWWKLSAYLGVHDLIHYVVENALGYENAFYGLIAAGWEQDWFGQTDPATGHKRALPARSVQEADCAEFIVMQLQAELLANGRGEDFAALLALSCEDAGYPAPPITSDQIERMRAEVRQLAAQWRQLESGGEIELRFAPTAAAKAGKAVLSRER